MFVRQGGGRGAREGAPRPSSRPGAPVEEGSEITKRYREQIDVVATGEEPGEFRWRGRDYRVLAVLGHWREDAGYWTGGGIEVPQRDLWRVEARSGGRSQGVYELVHEAGTWRLERVWD